MNDAKYIGLDVHQATISAAVLDSTGKLVMESVIETKAITILQFLRGLRGDCTSPWKKEPGPPGCTTCSSRTSPRWWCATRARTPC